MSAQGGAFYNMVSIPAANKPPLYSADVIPPISTATPAVDINSQPMRTTIDIDFITKAFVGIASPLLGVITSLQEQVEWSLRVASLCLGLAVGIISLVSMLKKMRRR
jgi:hypothetical protein